MSYQLKNDSGTVEAVIDDNCGMKKFYSVANMLANDLKIKFTEKQDLFDAIDWNFKYKGRQMKLHYSIYNGVSISPFNLRDNDAVTELASMLERKFY